MTSELSSSVTRFASAANVVASSVKGSAEASSKVLPVPKPEIMPIPKAEINFDSDRMLQNLRDSISKLNDMMVAGGRGLNFSMDQKLGRPIIYVKNSQTGEIVRQIPNEVIVQIAHGIEDFKGLLHNSNS